MDKFYIIANSEKDEGLQVSEKVAKYLESKGKSCAVRPASFGNRDPDVYKRQNQIAQEGAIQIFQEIMGGMEEIIVGVVGVLQFDVLKYRLENEYNVDIRLENLPYEHIRWIENKEEVDVKRLTGTSDMKKEMCIRDRNTHRI